MFYRRLLKALSCSTTTIISFHDQLPNTTHNFICSLTMFISLELRFQLIVNHLSTSSFFMETTGILELFVTILTILTIMIG